ncbi:MAG TPA: acyl-CoA dehydratase activase [Chitinivibrionales bacterium]|nr:acyl-CoA dehydratase activase [Chitinivibrionales bacterium]
MISTGIDVGARNVKVVILNDEKVVAKTMVPTGFDPAASASEALRKGIEQSGLPESEIKQIIATGVNAEMTSHATGKVSMVRAIAKAGTYLFPKARTVIDVGAEDARAVKCDDKGNIADFVANDRCAAGAGAFIEAMTRALELKLEEMGTMSLKADKAIPMNAQCVIFGESEVVTLIHQRTPKENIARAVYDAMSDRISSMVRRLGINNDVVLMGGVAKDVGLVNSLKKNLGIELFIPQEPEFASALGAALSSSLEHIEDRVITLPKVELGDGDNGKGVKKEYWRWPEYRKTVEGMDPKKAKVITAGIDVGSVGSKAAVMLDGELFSWAIMRTGSNSPDSARNVLGWALEGTGIPENEIKYIVGTGYGRVNVPMAKKAITEIACHGRGASYIWGPAVKTVLDVGGQDIKAIRVDEKGKITSFLMNDKCAAGTGRGMEVISDLLSVPIQEVGAYSLKVEKDPPPVSSTCVVFAKSEAVSLLRKGWSKEMVLASYCNAMSQRMFELLTKVGIEKEFVVTGGQSKNIGIVKRIERLIGFNCFPLPKTRNYDMDPQLAGAIGAALFSKALFEKEQGK